MLVQLKMVHKEDCSSDDSDTTLKASIWILQMTPAVSFPLPPVGQAIVDADPPHGAPTHALQLPEIIARRATAGVVLLVGGAATATALATREASPVVAARPLEPVVPVGADELEDRVGRNLGVDEHGGPIDHVVRRRPHRPRVGTSSYLWGHPRLAHRRDPPKHADIIG
jgi:hypothetical protein